MPATTRVATAVRRSAFDRLAEQEAEHGFAERFHAQGRFFRRGRAGGWRDELPARLADRIVQEHRDVMIRFGYLDPTGRPFGDSK